MYGILRREGLVKRLEVQLVVGKEYHAKTTGPHQMWATDASYFRVVGWGYYYLVTVMDGHSRFILTWKLQRDMAADSLIEVIPEAVDATGMAEVPVEDRTKLLSDNGPGYVSMAFLGTTCTWWASGTSWLRPFIPRPMGSWSATSRPSSRR